jgi:hypothetical protein
VEAYYPGGGGGGLMGLSGVNSSPGTETGGFNPNAFNGGSGGGGGWFSGEGETSGAGGSSYIGGVENGSTTSEVNEGNGYVIIRYTEIVFSDVNCSFGCTDPIAINFNALVSNDDGSCMYYGCIDPIAINYNPDATQGDNTCIYIEGCTYPDANNFNASAVIDNGTCTFDAPASCLGDLNNDAVVGVTDLLIFLSVFGTVCN